MSQKTSPFLEVKFGWDLGESGWNTGMDENLVKFSALLDGNIDGIVSSLPAPTTGLSYFLTSDNRIYFCPETTWTSSPVPENFQLTLKSTGQVYKFRSGALVLQPSLRDIQDTIDDLGSAAFEDSSNFVTPAQLDAELSQIAIPSFPTTSGISSVVLPSTLTYFTTSGYYTAGDGGGALFKGPLLDNPNTIDSVEVGYGDVSTRRWFRIVHKDSVCLEQVGGHGDSSDIFNSGSFRNESALITSAVNLASALGFNKVTSIGGKGYGAQDVLLGVPVEFDLNNSTFFGNFGAWGTSTVDSTPIYWTRRMFYTVQTNPVNVTFRRCRFNGQNSPSVQMAGGEVMIDLRGAVSPGSVKVKFIDCEITRGANRMYTTGSGITAPTAVLDYRNTDVLLYNIDEVVLQRCEIRSSPAEMVTIQSDDARTRWFVDQCSFTKKRDGSTAVWSSSALNVFNCGYPSAIQSSDFVNFVKGPANIETDGVSITNTSFRDVTDSNGLDFCESRAIRQNQFLVRNCYFSNISNVGIRASASNIICENNTFNRVDICHSFEGGVTGSSTRGSWVRVDPAPLNNITVRNPVYKSFNASHANLIGIRVIGASATLRADVLVDGNGSYDRPTVRPLYGVHATHCNLSLRGYQGEGRTAVIYLTGTCSLTANDVNFAPEAGQTVHTVLAENAVLGADSVNIYTSRRTTSLDSGFSDLRTLTSTVDNRAMNVTSSPEFPATSNGVVQINGELVGTVSAFNPPSVAAGSTTSTTVTVTGAVIGDYVRAVFSIDTAGLLVFARVTATGTVTVTFFNPTAAAIDIGGGNITCYVRQTR